MKNLILILLLVLTPLLSYAAERDHHEVEIVGPTTPISAGMPVMLTVRGLTESDRNDASVFVEPSDGVTLIPGNWGNMTFVVFWASKNGPYKVTVALNATHAEWRHHTDEGLEGATKAKIRGDLLEDFTSVAGRLSAAYPAKLGTFTLQVGTGPGPGPGPGPQPPPGPDPPLPPTTGKVWAVIIRMVDTMTADQSQVLSDLRQWSDEQPGDKVAHWEFAPDAVGPDGSPDKTVAAYVAKIPAGSTQPYVFIAQSRPEGGATILWHGQLPATADPVIAKIKEYVR